MAIVSDRLDQIAAVLAEFGVGDGDGDGSQPGALQSAELELTEQATAGTYTASLDVAAGTVVQDVWLYPLGAPWGADSAVFTMTDDVNVYGNQAYFGSNPIDLVSDLPTPYGTSGPVVGPVGVNWGDDYATMSPALRGSPPDLTGDYAEAVFYGGTGTSPTRVIGWDPGVGVRYATDATITAQIVTTIASPPVVPNGRMVIKVIYFEPVTAISADFS